MSKKLTVSELSAELGVSVNTVWKKIKKKGLTTTKDTVNNRVITFVLLEEYQLEELLQEQVSINQVNNGGNAPIYEDSATIHERVNDLGNKTEVVTLMEKIMEYSKEMNGQMKEYVERVIEAEKQVKLLEDSENRKNTEYHQLAAENKELRAKVEELESKIKIYESKWWNKPFGKK